MLIPNPDVKASNFFIWRELLWLPSWSRLANEQDGITEEILDNLNKLALKMDDVRRLLNCAINVHCAYRPPNYSVLVGGSPTDVHTQGLAMDFDCLPILTCDEVKSKLLSELVTLGIRMENNGQGAGWVHLDLHPVINNRYFNA